MIEFRGGNGVNPVMAASAAQLKTNLGIQVELNDTHGDDVQHFGGTPASGLVAFDIYGEAPVAADMVDDWSSVPFDEFNRGNRLDFANSEVDDLLSRARSTPSLSGSVPLVQEAERAVLADLPATPLWFRADRWVLNTRLVGFDTS